MSLNKNRYSNRQTIYHYKLEGHKRPGNAEIILAKLKDPQYGKREKNIYRESLPAYYKKLARKKYLTK